MESEIDFKKRTVPRSSSETKDLARLVKAPKKTIIQINAAPIESLNFSLPTENTIIETEVKAKRAIVEMEYLFLISDFNSFWNTAMILLAN